MSSPMKQPRDKAKSVTRQILLSLCPISLVDTFCIHFHCWAKEFWSDWEPDRHWVLELFLLQSLTGSFLNSFHLSSGTRRIAKKNSSLGNSTCNTLNRLGCNQMCWPCLGLDLVPSAAQHVEATYCFLSLTRRNINFCETEHFCLQVVQKDGIVKM